MATIDFNGNAREAFVEESVLGAARRHKEHIGYFCGGHGLCQTCEVVVSEGKDNLSPMTEVEKAWLSQEKQTNGHRLGCQSHVAKEGTVKLQTRTEMMRWYFNRAFVEQPKEASKHPQGYVGEFLEYFGKETVMHVTAVPFVAANAGQRLIKGEFTTNTLTDALNAWSERAPEVGDFVTKSANGMGDFLGKNGGELAKSITPMVDSLFTSGKSLVDSVFKSGASATVTKEGEKPIPVQIKKV
ncbi:MAG: 2Fe-2S iron-sulfur cluster-binding protein [Chloroherpetonaceae bacterium]|nr:2Fe-2S iron-sulfur cluster-binding protein [Chloroherpetonaceae bacterium]